MDENSHDIILMIIIGVIIIAQFYVFIGNYRKIQDYKKTIEKTKDFKIVEVAVPEEWIKEIEVDEILRNPEGFQNISSEFTSKMTEAPENDLAPNVTLNDPDQNFDGDEEFPEELEFPNTSKIEGNDEAYNDRPECCKYERKPQPQ